MRIIVAVMAFGIIISACTVSYRAELYPTPSSLITSQFSGSGSVSLKNEASAGRIPIGGPNSAGTTFHGDLRQITDIAISSLTSELNSRGFTVEENASKALKLKIVETRIVQEMGTRCTMQLSVETADGYKRAYSIYNSGFTHTRTCDGAISKGVAEILNDSKIIEYLK